ncbi:hypothetical protein LguiB_015894 [Lonicera macranthoides]
MHKFEHKISHHDPRNAIQVRPDKSVEKLFDTWFRASAKPNPSNAAAKWLRNRSAASSVTPDGEEGHVLGIKGTMITGTFFHHATSNFGMQRKDRDAIRESENQGTTSISKLNDPVDLVSSEVHLTAADQSPPALSSSVRELPFTPSLDKKKEMEGQERWCVVSGGRGFAPRHLVEMLIHYEMFSVCVANLGITLKLEPEEEKGTLGDAIRTGRAQYVDLRDKSQVHSKVEVVFHMAGPDSSINNYQPHHSVNVQGCEVTIRHNDTYAATKAEGEALVIKSNGKNGLQTCCIRPSSIFGPGDKLLVPSLVAAARAGKSKFIIGNGNNMNDFTYVENVAHAHICAELALASSGEVAERAAGEFASIKIPAFVMMPIAHIVEQTYKLLEPYRMKVPQLTPLRIRFLSCSRTFNCSKANDRLGYTPIVPF